MGFNSAFKGLSLEQSVTNKCNRLKWYTIWPTGQILWNGWWNFRFFSCLKKTLWHLGHYSSCLQHFVLQFGLCNQYWRMYEHVAGKRVGSVVCHYSVQFSIDLWHMEFRRVGTSIHVHHQSHILRKRIWWQRQEGIVLHWSILNTPYCLQACLFHERCVCNTS